VGLKLIIETKFMIFHKPCNNLEQSSNNNLKSIMITNDEKIDRVYERKYLYMIPICHL
jgi:hypothetical protein